MSTPTINHVRENNSSIFFARLTYYRQDMCGYICNTATQLMVDTDLKTITLIASKDFQTCISSLMKARTLNSQEGDIFIWSTNFLLWWIFLNQCDCWSSSNREHPKTPMTTMLTIKNSSIVLTSTCLRQSDGDQTRKMSNVWERIWEIHFFASPGKEERYSCVFWLKWRQPLEQTKSFENNCGRFEQSWKMSLPQSKVSNLLFQWIQHNQNFDSLT